MKVEDTERLMKEVRPILNQYKLEISEIDFGYKVYHIEEYTDIKKFHSYPEYKYPFLDIFLMEKKRKKW